MQQDSIQTNNSLVRQSREITESFPQLTGLPLKYWDKFISILRQQYEDSLTERTREGKKLTWIEAVQRIRYLILDPRTINYKHPERVIDAANKISKTRIESFGSDTPSGVVLDKKGRFHATNLLADVNYQNNTLTLEFPNTILMHFFGQELTVEYDTNIKQALKTKFGPILYQRCCIMENRLRGEFEMSEEDIRLALGIDFVSNPEILNKQIIREKDKLDISKGDEYDRFQRFKEKVIEPACDEINKLASEGYDVFNVIHEIISKAQYPRRRGAPSKVYSVIFRIYKFENDSEIQDVNIEDADAVEISPDSITPSPVGGTQIEMELNFPDDSDLTKSLVLIRDKITRILKASKATHTNKYVPGILKQIKERYSVCPDLPSIVLAWISYCENEVASKNGKEEEVSKLIQSNLKHHCQLYYKGNTYTGDRLPEYPPGFEPTIINVNPSVDDSQTNQYIILKNNNYGRNKANSAEERRAKLDRDAEEACRRAIARPYIPKVH